MNEDEIKDLERKIDHVKKRDSPLSIYNIGVYQIGTWKTLFLEKYETYGTCAVFLGFLTMKIVNCIRKNFLYSRGLQTDAVRLRTKRIEYAKKRKKKIPLYNKTLH